MLRKWLREARPDSPPVVARSDPEALFSPEAMRRAWRVVRANAGAAGVDGVTIRQFEADLEGQLETLRQELVRGRYEPLPVKRVLVPKPKGDWRPLALWALRDRVAQRVVYEAIAPTFEAGFRDCSYGFRPGRGVEDAVQAVLSHRDAGHRWVLDADIEKCFDRMDSRRLMGVLHQRIRDRRLLRLIESWLRARIFNTLSDGRARAGTSQGSVLSPLLANIYLHPLDVALNRRGYRLVRYADDLVVCCEHKREAQKARSEAARTLARLRLSLHEDKTRIVHFDEGFTFLGYFFVRNEHYRL